MANPKIKDSQVETASLRRDPDLLGWGNYLGNPDKTLIAKANGEGIKLYDEVDKDPHAGSVLQTRYLAVVGKEWSVVPAESQKSIGRNPKESKEQKVARFVESVLVGCNFDEMRKELLQAILYGYYGAEIIWKVKDGAIVIDRFYGKHPRRFCFNIDREPRLITTTSLIDGEALPDKKFLIFQYGDSDNPYGKGLGQKLWWYVWFKKHGIKFWNIFMEKFGMPTPIGKYPTQAKEQRTKLLDAIKAIQTDTAIVIPDTMSVEFMEASRSGDGSYAAACEYFDRQISKAVLGQTLTTEVGSTGSYAASQTHNDVRQDIIEADADLLDAYLNKTIVSWIVNYNFPGVVNYPQFVTYAGAKPDLEARSRIDASLVNTGLPIAKSYFYETYGVPVPEEGEEVVERSAPQPFGFPGDGQGQEPGFSEFSGKKKVPTRPDVRAQQKVIDKLADKTVERGKPVFKSMVKPIMDLVDNTESLEEIERDIFDLYQIIDADDLESLVLNSKIMANLYGRAVVQEIDRRWSAWEKGRAFAEDDPQPKDALTEIVFEPLPPERAMKFFRGKVLLSSKDFYDLTDQLRAEAFTVSRVAKMDIIKDIHEAVQAAIDEGETLRGFRGRLDNIVQAKGWGGLEPWHEETVFRTNIQTAYSVGHEQEVQGMEDMFPYAQYVAIDDDRVRPEHLALNGLIFPINSSFWDNWTPPSGYNCFPLGTNVLTPYGWENIEFIGINDRVIGGSGKEQSVTAIHRNAFNGKLVRLIFEDGMIDSTPNHRILTINGWKRADTIKKCDILVQTNKLTLANSFIPNIDKSNTSVSDIDMSIPIKIKSGIVDTFNSKFKGRDENINPPGADKSFNDMIVNRFKFYTFNKINDYRFTSSRLCFRCSMIKRIFSDLSFLCYNYFISNFRSFKRSRYFQFFSGYSSSIIGLFSFAKSGVSAFFVHLNNRLSHFFTCFDVPFFRCMEPLSTYGFTTAPWFNRENLEKFGDSPVIDVPFSTKLPIGKFFDNVQTVDDFSKAAPFDMFNTVDDFRNWLTQNAILHKVESVGSISYNGTVVNLSIDKDNSYIVQGATVHNCRCSKRFIHRLEAEQMSYKVETGNPTGSLVPVQDKATGDVKFVKLEPDKGFAANPAKSQWVPSKEDYPEPLWGKYEQEKELVSK